MPSTVLYFNPAAEFSVANNPNAVWTHGYESTLGLGFTTYDQHSTTYPQIDSWVKGGGADGNPGVYHNGTADTITLGGTAFVNPGELIFHPGPAGEYSIVRFTASDAGLHQIKADFSVRDINPGGTDVHVLVNGAPVFDSPTTTANFSSQQIMLPAGTTIDFAVGYGSNGNYFNDSTGLAVTITVEPVNNAPTFIGSNQTVDEDAPAQSITGWASFNPGSGSWEATQQVSSYTVSNISNPSLFSSQPSVDANGTLTYALAANANGASTFDVSVKDDGGTANGGVDTSAAQTFTIIIANTLDASGAVLVGLEHQDTSGLVATFMDSDFGAIAANYSATILWGDAQSSAGVITANGGGNYTVTGGHAYQQEGPYAVAVQIHDVDGDTAVAGSYVSILPLDDHASVQTILSSSISGSGSFTEKMITEGAGTYDITAKGAYSYTLTVGLIDGLYDTVNTTTTGAFNFKLHEAGQEYPNTFTLDNYTIEEDGSANIQRVVEGSDLEGTFTRTENGTQTTLNLAKNGNDTTGVFMLAGNLSTSLNIVEDGAYGGNTYHSESEPTTTTILGNNGNYLAGDGKYIKTRTDTTPTTTWKETGNVYSDAYVQDGSYNDFFTIGDEGNLFTGAYKITGSGTTNPSFTETGNNGVAITISTAGGDPITSTLGKNGDWNTGVYTDYKNTAIANNRTGGLKVTDQTYTGKENWTGSGTSIWTQNGNALIGDYGFILDTTGMGSGEGNFDNQMMTATGDGNASGDGFSKLTQGGNVLTKDYLLHLFSKGKTDGGGKGINQNASGNFTGSASGFSNLMRNGNTMTGAYTLQNVSVLDNATSSGKTTNQFDIGNGDFTLFGSGGFTLPTATSTSNETGNTKTGAYILHVETTGGATTNNSDINQTASGGGSITASPLTKTTLDEFGNRKTGAYTVHQVTLTPTFSGPFNNNNLTANAAGTTTGSSSTTLDSTGNLTSGIYNSTEITDQTSISNVTAGNDSRGKFTSTTTVTSTSATTKFGNTIASDYTLNVNSTSTTFFEKSGGNGDTTYSQNQDATSSSGFLETGNAVTGVYAQTAASASSSHMVETGAYLTTTTFTIDETNTSTSSSIKSGNSIKGPYTMEAGTTAASFIHAVGGDGAGSYDHLKTQTATQSWNESGNSVTGDYIRGGGFKSKGSTIFESNTYAAGSAAFLENMAEETFAFTETGNAATDVYDRTELNGIRSSSLTDGFTDASGAYAVGQSSLGIFTRTTASGKGVIGDYTKTETASDTYAMSESGSGTKNFTLSQTGTNSYTDIEIGNTSTGVYTRTKIGLDSYSMQEDGSKAGDPYAELVTGADNYTLIDNGNLGTGKYTRTIDGGGNYDRTVTGLGATLPTDSGTISYRWEQTGDPHSGTFNLTQTGADRYDLLEDFHDVSNTQPGQTPGHMNIYPFGQTFVDGPWGNLLGNLSLPYDTRITITTSSGQSFNLINPTVGSLRSTLRTIQFFDDTISVMSITGHGNAGVVYLTSDLQHALGIFNGGVVIQGPCAPADDISSLLNSITNANSIINLNSCYSNGFAPAFSAAVPNATVNGIGNRFCGGNTLFGLVRMPTAYRGGRGVIRAPESRLR